LKTVTSNQNYTSTIPPSVVAQIVGCMNPSAMNYNPNATISREDLCVFPNISENVVIDEPAKQTKVVVQPKQEEVRQDPPPPPKPVLCNDPNALNYGLEGVCIYPPIKKKNQ